MNSRLCWCVILTCGLLNTECSLADEKSTAAQAIATYEEAMAQSDRSARLQEFAIAEQLFQQTITHLRQNGETPSSDLLLALGNSALQAEHIGTAIVAYRETLTDDPANPQARQNLEFARSLLPVSFRYESSTALTTTLFFWKDILARNQQMALAALCFAIAALLFSFSVARGNAMARRISLLPLTMWLVLVSAIYLSDDNAEQGAVIVIQECTLRSADSVNSPARLKEPLPSGAELALLRRRDEWTEVTVKGRSGWLRNSSIEIIE